MTLNQEFYRLLYLCRKVEEIISAKVKEGLIRLPIHLSIGEEFTSVGIGCALEFEDVVFGTYRGHALYLSKGGDLKQMLAEIYGKASGCSRGRGGSMHLIDTRAGFMGTSGIVASGIPNAVGYAYGIRRQNRDDIVLCTFGDGAVDEGVFHESLNFAALKKLNVIFFCENNSFAIRSHQSARQSLCDISKQAEAHGVPSAVLPSRIDAVYNAIKQARILMLKQPGPRFFECPVGRWKEHLGPNDDVGLHISTREMEEWKQKDELLRIGNRLSPSAKSWIEDKVDRDIEEAFAFAEDSPFTSIADLYSDVFYGDQCD